MIDTLLQKFIQEFNQPKGSSPSALQQETYYAAIQGDFERYIRWKFLNFIYNQTQGNASTVKKPREGKTVDLSDDFTLSLESFDRNDMIFKHGKDIHFLEWKAMTFPVSNQNKKEYDKKFLDNFRQLCKSRIKYDELINIGFINPLTPHFWSAFVFVDYDSSLFYKHTKPSDRLFDRQGNFQKYPKKKDKLPILKGKKKQTAHYVINGNKNKSQVLHSNASAFTLSLNHVHSEEVELYFQLFSYTNTVAVMKKNAIDSWSKVKLNKKVDINDGLKQMSKIIQNGEGVNLINI